MTVISEVAKRYASALFESINDQSKAAKLLEELRAFDTIIHANKEIKEFFASPLISGDEKAKAVVTALESGNASEDIKKLARLLASKDRLEDWGAIVAAFQVRTDEAHGIVRGLVRSASPLGPDQRKVIEQKVAQVTAKKVILEYKEDPSLLGGLVAEVGSLTFDDSLETQLKLMNEEIRRSAH